MNRNIQRIGDALRSLSVRPYDVMAGKVVAGSMDEDAFTVSVLPTGGDTTTVVKGVLLNTIESSSLGLLLVPKDESDVVIGSIDGSGEWTVLKANELKKLMVNIDDVTLELTGNSISIKNGNTELDIGTATFRVNTASESLYQLLNDLITALTTLTVGTPAGVSTVPTNAATFAALLTRLNNLLNP